MITKNQENNWPYSLLDALIEERDDRDIFTGTPDQLDGLNYALTTLFDREYAVLLKRYHIGKSLEEVGKDFGVTRERIRQIEAKALRKLRHPQRMGYILNGLYGEEKRLALEKMARARELAEAAAEEADHFDDESKKLSLPIENMDLSVRSYNCLKRAGVNIVGDIAAMSMEKLLHTRNLGRKSLEEVLSKLHALGVRGTWE